MPTIRPLRVNDEHDVVNFYTYSGALPAVKGTIVKVVGSGSVPGQAPVSMFGSVGAQWANTVSTRWAVTPQVTVCSSGDTPFGMLLYDVRQTDENGEQLIYNPTKAAEMQAVLSGQAVPIVFKGIFDFSGVVGNPTAGATAFTNNNGDIGTISYGSSSAVGKFLGVRNAQGIVRLKLDL